MTTEPKAQADPNHRVELETLADSLRESVSALRASHFRSGTRQGFELPITFTGLSKCLTHSATNKDAFRYQQMG